MQALIPNKDILFTLSSFQKDFLSETGCFPVYPLWAFTELPLTESTFSSCTINAPESDGKSYFFPVEIEYSDKSDTGLNKTKSAVLKIVFADIVPGADEKNILINKNAFPLNQRVFRTAQVECDSSSWKIICENWQKLTN